MSKFTGICNIYSKNIRSTTHDIIIYTMSCDITLSNFAKIWLKLTITSIWTRQAEFNTKWYTDDSWNKKICAVTSWIIDYWNDRMNLVTEKLNLPRDRSKTCYSLFFLPQIHNLIHLRDTNNCSFFIRLFCHRKNTCVSWYGP